MVVPWRRLGRWIEPEPMSGCWLWIGARTDKGYGTTGSPSRLVHRVIYQLVSGSPIPPGMQVCHRCDVRCCVNPAHLFVGTAKDNTHDAMKKDRLAKGIHHG